MRVFDIANPNAPKTSLKTILNYPNVKQNVSEE
jgi:hypothetical protein